MEQIIHETQNKVLRQSLSNRIVHWTIAISTVVLIFSGFGQMPMYNRYGISSIPGLLWSANYNITIIIHYIVGIILTFAVFYHVVYHIIRKEFDILPKAGDFKESVLVIGSMLKLCKAPMCEKYVGEQRLAYAFIGGNILALILTGYIKIIKNTASIELSQTTIYLATAIHNVAAAMILIGVIGHLAAFLFKENRELLPAMFTGYVDLDYVEERHIHWYNKISKKKHPWIRFK